MALISPPAEDSANSEEGKQLYQDRRIAAADALQHFKHYKATEALVQVLKNEKKDTALRDQAHQSLQVATGKKLPPDHKAWDELLHPPGDGSGEAVAGQKKKATLGAPIIQTGGEKGPHGGARVRT